MNDNNIYDYQDKSQLYRAWEKYYDHVSYKKKLGLVLNRVRIGKFPKEKGEK
jgi:hypothetical protein